MNRKDRMLAMLPALLCGLTLPVQAAAIKAEEMDVLIYGAYITGGALLYIAAGKLFKYITGRRK